MGLKGRAYVAGIYEHPTRKAPDKSVAQLHAECARGALADAGLGIADVDGYFCAGDAPGLGQTMKLTNNYLSATANIATAEAMVMGVKAGLDPAVMVDVFNASSGRNDSTMNKVPNAILKRRFATRPSPPASTNWVRLWRSSSQTRTFAPPLPRSLRGACRRLGLRHN